MKIVNLVLGLGTAIIVGSLIVLGIKAFYPAPTQPAYLQNVPSYPQVACAAKDVACQKQQATLAAQQQAAQVVYNNQAAAYANQMQIYDRNLFVIANIVGIIIFVVAFWLLFATSIAAQSVPIGIMIAGLWGIIYGYHEGWGSVDDKLKFLIGLVIALLVIGGSVWLIERYSKKMRGQ